MNAPLLSIEALTLNPDGNPTLHGFSATLKAGGSLAILGANGAGKSSLLRAVMGFEQPEAGRVLFNGQDLTTMRARDRATLGIGFCPEGRRLFPGLTIEETLAVAFVGPTRQRRMRIDEILDMFPALASKRQDRAWSLSGGQQQMLAIARAIMSQPRLVLLDEPTLGLAPMVIDEVLSIIRTITATGTGVLLAEQNVGPALRVAEDVIVLVRGSSVYTGQARALSPSQAVKLLLSSG
jgi:branched-chain amino acid transport system ATP-binding protein